MDLVGYGHGAGLEHFVIELFLLQIGQLGLKLVVVDGIGRRTLGESAGDFFADSVLFFEVLPM